MCIINSCRAFIFFNLKQQTSNVFYRFPLFTMTMQAILRGPSPHQVFLASQNYHAHFLNSQFYSSLLGEIRQMCGGDFGCYNQSSSSWLLADRGDACCQLSYNDVQDSPPQVMLLVQRMRKPALILEVLIWYHCVVPFFILDSDLKTSLHPLNDFLFSNSKFKKSLLPSSLFY